MPGRTQTSSAKAKHRGGVFLGPLPKNTTKTKQELEEKAIQDRTSQDGDGTVEDDILADVDRSDPNSFVTFARGDNAVGLLTKNSLLNIISNSKSRDPLTREPLHKDVQAFGLRGGPPPPARSFLPPLPSSFPPRPPPPPRPAPPVPVAAAPATAAAPAPAIASRRTSSRLLDGDDDRGWRYRERLVYMHNLESNTSYENEDIRRHYQEFVDQPAQNLTDMRDHMWGRATFQAYVHSKMRDLYHLLRANHARPVPEDFNIYYLHILPHMRSPDNMTIVFAALLGTPQKWYVIRYLIPEPIYPGSGLVVQQLDIPVNGNHTLERLEVIMERDTRDMFILVKYSQPVLFSSLMSPSSGGGHARSAVLHKTPEKATIGNQTRVIYTNARGTKFIRLNGSYMHLSKALKNKH